MSRGWSAAQKRVIATPGVKLIGIDSKMRPIVQQMTGIPQQLREWAVLKNGEPTDVTEPSRRD